MQLAAKRHFVMESPLSSRLWYVDEVAKLLQHPRVVCVLADQCMLGLVDPEGHPTKKATMVACRSEVLARRLNVRCNNKHTHVRLEGSVRGISRTSFAQTWPVQLCERIIAGLLELKHAKVAAAYSQFFPAVAQAPAPVPVPAPVPPGPKCPGCVAHAFRGDSRHSRVVNVCKFPDDVALEFTCKACQNHLPSHHPKHTLEFGGCHWAEAQPRLSGVPGSVNPRVPRVPQQPVVEAAQDDGDGDAPPPTPAGLKWRKVIDPEVVLHLDSLRHTSGWSVLNQEPYLVELNGRFLRTTAPRYESALYPRRSTFGMFPEHNQTSPWWQLEHEVVCTKEWINVGYRVPMLVQRFHAPAAPPPDASTNRKIPPQDVPVVVVEAPAGPGPSVPPARPVPAVPKDGPEEDVEIPAIGPAGPAEDGAAPQRPDWSSFDLGRSLRLMRSGNPALITKAVRQLRLRWWHASAERMCNILRHAHVPKEVLDVVQAVHDTCAICRQWQRPRNKSNASSKLSTEFNQSVETDLLFIKRHIVCHLINLHKTFHGWGNCEQDRGIHLHVHPERVV